MTATYIPDEMRNRLQEALDNKRMSMRAASLEAGLSETALHGIVKLGRDPGVSNLVKVCDVLDVTLGWIMYGQDLTPENAEVLQLLQDNPSKRDAILALLRE